MLATTLEYDPYLGRVLTGRIDSGSVRAQHAGQGAGPRRRASSSRRRLTKLLAFRGLERVPARGGAGRRHRRRRRAVDEPPSPTPSALPRSTTRAAGPADRPADPGDDLLGQRRPLAGRDGEQGHLARDRRAAASARPRATSRSGSRAERPAGRLRGRRPRRIAARRADRDDAPRGLRDVRSAGRACCFQTDPATGAAAGADRGGRDRRRRGVLRHRGREDEPAQGRAAARCGRPAAASCAWCSCAPSRALIGYHGEFLTDTRGTGVMSRLFHGYAPYKGAIEGRRNGVLISLEQGAAVAYALWNLEERGADVHRPRRRGLCRHDHRRAQPRQRPRRQPAQGQAADQHPRRRQGRGGAADPAACA